MSVQTSFELNDTVIEETFTTAFESQVAQETGIEEFTLTIDRDLDQQNIQVVVSIFEYAGCPTIDEFKSGSVENADQIVIEDIDGAEHVFALVNDECHILTGNEYALVYKSL